MNKEFIPYEEALALKELGFDEICLGMYYEDGELEIREGNHSLLKYLNAPLYQQVFKFFRSKYNMKFYIREDTWNHWCTPKILISDTDDFEDIVGDYETYEEAELECLKKLIEIVKKGKTEIN